MSLTDLTGQKILITGGCGAIGRVIVETFVEHGAKVGVNDILDEEQALEILKAIKRNDQIVYLRADVTDPESVGSLFDRFEKELGGLPDTVCCHAGITGSHPVQEYPVEEYDRLMAVNLRSSFLVSQEAARRWIAASIPGHLIYTTSWVQDVPWPEITPYNVSKAGMKAMMRGFARELAPHGIRANAVAPGIVAVGMAKAQWDNDPSYRARAKRAIPLGFMQPPESVAHAFLFLASKMASYMTGSVLVVDGGCSLYPMDE